MIRDLMNDIFSRHSSFRERCTGTFFALLLLTAVGATGVLGFVLLDSAGVNSTDRVTTVIEAKDVSPSRTSFILVGKVLVPQYLAGSYRIHFKIEEKEVSASIEKEFYDKVNIKDKIEVSYGVTRLRGNYHPTQIKLVDR